ncbi:hypothetical protein [Pseudidiomarina sediminum]|nr:hypothetical protein [Pseudidiomarina sediminum]
MRSICPMFHNHASSILRHQRGAALAIAIFIIVVLSLIGLTVVKMVRDATMSTVVEVYGTRTEAAARSGAELFLTQLFPLSAPTQTALCPVRVGTTPQTAVLTQNLAAAGLDRCSIRVFCDRLDLSAPYQGTHFRIVSQANCHADSMQFSRQLLLEASDGIE